MDRETETQTHKLDWTPQGGNIWLDLYICIHCPPHTFLDFYDYYVVQQNMCTFNGGVFWYPKIDANDRKERRTEIRTYKLDLTPLGDKFIVTLDPQSANEYKYISIVGVQRRDASIFFGHIYIYIYIWRYIQQYGMHAITGWALWSPKSDADDLTERQRDGERDRETEKEAETQTHKLDWTSQVSSGPLFGG